MSLRVKTIIVAGFPDDVIQRELDNLVCFFPDYEDSWMLCVEGRPICIARFHNPMAAEHALRKLHYHQFDNYIRLRCEMAAYDPQHHGQYVKPFCPNSQQFFGGERQVHNTDNTDNTCNTVFIGKLSHTVLEEELLAELRTRPGFVKVRMVKKEDKPFAMAFAEFENHSRAQEAVAKYPIGLTLESSDSIGLVSMARTGFISNPYKRQRMF